MNKTILDKTRISDFILANRFRIDSESRFISRCIDGRYSNDPGLPALAMPGADMGQLGVIFAASQVYGFDIDPEKTYRTIAGIVGGEENISCHTSTHGKEKIKGRCGYIEMLSTAPETYNVEDSHIEFINNKFFECSKRKNILDLQGDHLEGAVLIVKGDYGINPQYRFSGENEETSVQAFVFHQSLIDERHRRLATDLVKNEAVTLLGDTDEEYLYEVISDTCENHFFETIKRLGGGLPIYYATFTPDGKFKTEEGGFVYKD